MKKLLLASAAMMLPMMMTACTTATLPPEKQAAVDQSQAVRTEIDELNQLTRIYIDSVTIYQEAANKSNDLHGLKPAIIEIAQERNRQRVQLQDRVIALGGTPAEYGEASGTVRRSMASIRSILQDDNKVALEEVLRTERYILREVDDAMNKTVTPESRQLLGQLRTDADQQIARLEEIGTSRLSQ